MFGNVSLYLQVKEEKDLAEVCKRLMVNMLDGECSLTWQLRDDKLQFDSVEIHGLGEVASSCQSHRKYKIFYKTTWNKLISICLAVKESLATEHYNDITKVGVYILN